MNNITRLRQLQAKQMNRAEPTGPQRACLNRITTVWLRTVEDIRDGRYDNAQLEALAHRWESLGEDK